MADNAATQQGTDNFSAYNPTPEQAASRAAAQQAQKAQLEAARATNPYNPGINRSAQVATGNVQQAINDFYGRQSK